MRRKPRADQSFASSAGEQLFLTEAEAERSAKEAAEAGREAAEAAKEADRAAKEAALDEVTRLELIIEQLQRSRR